MEKPAPWEFDSRESMLSLLIGNDFGSNPESQLNAIRVEKVILAKKIARALKLKKSDVVIEIGSGIGFMAGAIASKVKELHCCDISESFLGAARENCRDQANIFFRHITPGKLGFAEPASIDAIYSHNVFVHLNIYDIYLYLREAQRVLKPGGLLYFDHLSSEHFAKGGLTPQFLEMAEHYENCSVSGRKLLLQYHSSTAIIHLATAMGFKLARNQFAHHSARNLVFRKVSGQSRLARKPLSRYLAEVRRYFWNRRN